MLIEYNLTNVSINTLQSAGTINYLNFNYNTNQKQMFSMHTPDCYQKMNIYYKKCFG